MECPFAEADYKLLYKQDAKTEPKTWWTIRMKELPECHTIVERRLLATFPDEGFSECHNQKRWAHTFSDSIHCD